MNILVTGANGQLGSEIKLLENKYFKHKFYFTDISELDITQSYQIDEFVDKKNIDVIINCAAYINTDKAEEEKELAYEINVAGSEYLSKAAKLFGCKLIHISTDYVFDGKAKIPYKENDKTSPINVYGKSKLESEERILKENIDATIIRTSWVYSSFGNNFVKSILEQSRIKDEIEVVIDQVGTPTYAADLANTIMLIVDKSIKNELYHYTNEGQTSWYDFAKEILYLSKINCKVKPVYSKDFKSKAVRPKYSVLDKSKIKNDFNLSIPDWKHSLKKCINLIIKLEKN